MAVVPPFATPVVTAAEPRVRTTDPLLSLRAAMKLRVDVDPWSPAPPTPRDPALAWVVQLAATAAQSSSRWSLVEHLISALTAAVRDGTLRPGAACLTPLVAALNADLGSVDSVAALVQLHAAPAARPA